MSRHQMTVDVDEYYDEEEGDEELEEDDEETLRAGAVAVRAELGPEFKDVSDAQIRESLWHYYFDVEKTVAYLQKTKEPKVKKAKNGRCEDFFACDSTDGLREGVGDGNYVLDSGDLCTAWRKPMCSVASIPGDFWEDMRWFQTSSERQSLFIPPFQPRGGLLGGAPEAPAKMSKLQALAAARKKKAQEQKIAAGNSVENPMAGLSIGEKSAPSTSPAASESSKSTQNAVGSQGISRDTQRTYPLRKRKNSSPHRKSSQHAEPLEPEVVPLAIPRPPSPAIETAEPSAFANTMFSVSSTSRRRKTSNPVFTLPYSLQNSSSSANTTDAFTGPSPDDIVIAAQSKAANLKNGTAKSTATKGPVRTNGEKKADQIANGVEAMRLDDTPRAKSKNLDVLAEYEKSKPKNAANFVVIGHVDAGKSTLMGRLLYDLNVVDQRTIDRYRKEAEKMGKASFALAWVLDQGTEERSRGVTIDIATNKFETSKTTFTILDAPGHRDFIPNMIAGASQADFAVLVIDASTGSFESGLKGQTREHAHLVRSMGVQRLIIAVNKLDTVSWSQDRFDEISQQVSAFLLAAGFQSRNLSFIPMSGLHGDNIVNRSTSPDAAWYTGRTLVEELDHSEPISRALDKPLRFTIGDIFRGGVQNPLSVSGRIEAGSCQMGDALLALPANEKCYIRSLEVDNEASEWAVAGQNVTIHLSDIDPIHLKVGDVLCSPTSPIPCVKEFTAKVLAFDHLIPGGVEVHRGRLHAAGKIREMLAVLDKTNGNVLKKKPKVVQPAMVARVVVVMDVAVPLEKGQRVVLRSGGSTIAAGLLE